MTALMRGGIAFTALAAVLIQYATFMAATDLDPLGGTIRYFSYFTITTNCLVAFSWGVQAFAPSSRVGVFFSRDSVRTAIAGYIVLVGTVYHLLLSAIHNPDGIEWFANHLLHTIVPAAVFLEWLLNSGDRSARYAQAIAWQVYPVIYTIYTLIKGAVTGFYPYPFLDVNVLQYSGVAINFVGLSIGFVLSSLLFVAIGRLQVQLAR